MTKVREKISRFFRYRIWETPPNNKTSLKSALFYICRVFFALQRDFRQKQLTLYATSLVYTTLLSLVPLLAVSFSVLHAFGIHNKIEPLLFNLMAPLGDKAPEITNNILTFVENINVGVLGAIGVTILLYTTISTISKIETAFNYIWKQTKPRPWLRRVTDYLSVLTFGPVLVLSAIGLIASMSNNALTQALLSIEPIGSILIYSGQLTPYFLIIAAFTFVYVFIPNTRVSLKAAFLGAVIAGVTWKCAGWLFALFVTSSTNYDAIYSSLGILLFFIIWLELSWLILLIGAQLSFYFQNPQFMKTGLAHPRLTPSTRELLGLYTMDLIIARHNTTHPPLHIEEISRALVIPNPVIEELLNAFVDDKIIIKSAEHPHAYLLARAPEHISIYQVIHAIRQHSPNDVSTHHLNLAHINQIQSHIERCLEHNFAKSHISHETGPR